MKSIAACCPPIRRCRTSIRSRRSRCSARGAGRICRRSRPWEKSLPCGPTRSGSCPCANRSAKPSAPWWRRPTCQPTASTICARRSARSSPTRPCSPKARAPTASSNTDRAPSCRSWSATSCKPPARGCRNSRRSCWRVIFERYFFNRHFREHSAPPLPLAGEGRGEGQCRSLRAKESPKPNRATAPLRLATAHSRTCRRLDHFAPNHPQRRKALDRRPGKGRDRSPALVVMGLQAKADEAERLREVFDLVEQLLHVQGEALHLRK